MADDHNLLPLGNARVAVRGEKQHFNVSAASIIPRGKHRVRLLFEGRDGSVAIDLPRVIFWGLTTKFHEQAAAADFAEPPKPRSTRRKRS